MGGKPIINIKPFVEDDSSGAASDTQENEAITFGYFKDQRGKLEESIKKVSDNALNRKNPGAIESNIDMAKHSITNLKDPEAHQATYAANVTFVANAIVDNNTVLQTQIVRRIIESFDIENVFKKVMDDDEFKEDDSDIHKSGVQNKNFQLVNKKTYEFKIDYDSSIGSYTMVYEMYDDDGITIYEIDARSGTLSVGKINSEIDGKKTRSIIHFTKNIFAEGFDYLDIDVKSKGKTDPQTTSYVVVYGVEGQVNDVSVNLWDRLYYYDNASVKYEASIDMNRKDITNVNKIVTNDLDVNGQIDMNTKKMINLGEGTANNDAVNKAQLEAVESQVTTVNNKVTQNKTDIATMGYYYFADQLKHNNSNTVKFPAVSNNYPYSADNNSEFLMITLDGHYQIIYTDFYTKGKSSQFIIHDDTNGNDLFTLSSLSPITINTVIPITTDNGFNHAKIKLYIKNVRSKKIRRDDAILEGASYSTFYIKYLHA